MRRRDLLKTAGVFTAAALIPRDALATWERVASGMTPRIGLNDPQLSLVGAIADTLIPRTTSPGALDVGVPAFVNLFVSESHTPEDRQRFTSGLAMVEVHLRDSRGCAFVDLDTTSRGARIADMESHGIVYRAAVKVLRRGEPLRTYWQLKQLIVHGYFTSEVVAKEILRDQIVPGSFDGAAPFSRKAAMIADGEHRHA